MSVSSKALNKTQHQTKRRCLTSYHEYVNLVNHTEIGLYRDPYWNDARLHHGDIAEFLELEHRRSTIGRSGGRVRDLDLETLSFAHPILDRIKRFPKERL
ncbi:hypothetical protein T4D_8062 [Trichinella pseudospiralis]|uniref:Uncharacterized protein n=1 Tax=Trichinella pseudospiralis TaxID=6337 RepID=A0A0V1FWV4_TRIPS|nr:hypothetical protein T4D_8062 [Trichinella pseudospiralis]